MNTLEFHPLAAIFPLIEGPDFDELVTDIRAHGLHEPIVVFEDKVLDGRNRLRACQAAGVEPTFTVYTGAVCALPVPSLATRDAVLFMWTTAPHLRESFDVLVAWGFEYKTNIVWVKDKIGLGYFVRNQHALLLVATRGDMLSPLTANRPPSVISAPRREHSRKPDEAYEMIERMYPELPKIELFARQERPGWRQWGNEVAVVA
jgi:N6-adenosine-specific RNA methylase IME4